MPTLKSLQPKKLTPRQDLTVAEFRAEMFRHGSLLEWQMASACPCGRKFSYGGKTGDYREKPVDCPECDGTGILYHSKQTVRGLIVSAERHPEGYRLFGEHQTARARITLLPEHLPSYLDRFVDTENVLVYRERRERTNATVEMPRYPVVRRTLLLGTSADATVSETVTRGVLYARAANLDGDITGSELVEGSHFTVTSDGEVDWSLSQAAATAGSKDIFAPTPGNVTVGMSITFTVPTESGGTGTATPLTFVAAGTGFPTSNTSKSPEVSSSAATLLANILGALNNGAIRGLRATAGSGFVRVKVAGDDFGSAGANGPYAGSWNNAISISVSTGSGLSLASGSVVESGTFAGGADGPGPRVGAYYALHYYANPVYLVTNYPHNTRSTVVDQKGSGRTVKELPIVVTAELEFLGGSDG